MKKRLKTTVVKMKYRKMRRRRRMTLNLSRMIRRTKEKWLEI
jgi:hypothetical protein